MACFASILIVTVLVIDRAGHAHSATSLDAARLAPTLHDQFQSPAELYNVASVEVRGRVGTLKVIPDRLSYAGYSTIARVLEQAAPQRIVLSWHSGRWYDEIIVGTTNEALRVIGQRVLSLMTETRIDRGDRFRLLPASLGDLPSTSPLRRLIEMWRANDQNIDLTKQHEAVSALTNGQYCVFRSSTDAPVPIFDTFGPGWEIYKDRSWMDRSVGRPVTDQPDVRYGQWIAGYLHNAFGADGPTLSKVEAVISDPTGLMRKRSHYTRLTLPMRLDSGLPGLLSAPHVSSITRL